MKRTLFILLLCITLCLGSLVVTGCGDAPSENLEYAINSDLTFTVKGIGECADKKVVIPSTYNGAPVTAIGEYAFSGYAIESVVIPDSVKTIGKFAFADCDALTDIDIKGTGVDVGYRAFSNCDALENLTIKKGVFYDAEVFYASAVNNITFEDGVSELTNSMFRGLGELKGIELPSSLTKIGELAFAESGLEGVIIPEGVVMMGSYVFADCKDLDYVTSEVSAKPEGWSTSWCKELNGQQISADVLWDGHVHTLTLTSEAKPNCIMGGSKTYTCSSCNKTRTEFIPASPEYHVPRQEDWEADGTKHWRKCNLCTTNYEYGYHDKVDGKCTICGK